MEQDAFQETQTILKVRGLMMKMGLSEGASETIINNLLNAGILFEEIRR